ncbi:MAG: hypothetical protein CMJ18_05450 [Phycisphaeraceae bacterium]|nr:hypothetical protein [Phycisphaeraceae bacterium]
MAQAGTAFSSDQAPPEAMRSMRAAFLKAWGESCEQAMRSPEFLEAVRKAMAGAIEMRRQTNEWLGRLQHEFQGTSRQDVDQIMLVMKHLEQRLVDGFERIEGRLDEFDTRLDDLEAKARSGARPARRAARPASVKTRAPSGKSARKSPRKKKK